MQYIFFIPVLRVRNPLRIRLLPESVRATGSLLTRDDAGEKFGVSLGLDGRSCPRSLSTSSMATEGDHGAAPSLHCEGADVGKALSLFNDLTCIV